MPSLNFFQRVIWIDPGKNVAVEVQQYSIYYEDKFEFFQSPNSADQFLATNDLKSIIFCSSTYIAQVYKLIQKYQLVFPKMLVFCGYKSKADEIMKTNPYRQAIYGAYCQQFNIIITISQIQDQLLKNPNKMNDRVKITIQAPVNAIAQNKAEKNKKKEQQQPKKVEKEVGKKVDVVKKNKNKSNVNKLQNLFKLYWVCNQKQEQKELRQNYIDRLQQQGYKFSKIDTQEYLKYQIQEQQQSKCIIISKVSVSVQQLMVNCQNIQFNLRLTQSQNDQPQQGEHPECRVHSLEDIQQKLKNICIQNKK